MRCKSVLPWLFAASRLVAGDSFDWTSITPSPNLEYHDCFDGLQCARLEVPMDWHAAQNSSGDGPTVAIALTKLPAIVSANDSSYAGPIFVNPGGPGGSGIEWITTAASTIQLIVDTPGERHFDLISFDPRGIGQTTPAVDCYPGDDLARRTALLEDRQTFGMRSSLVSSMPYALGRAKAFGKRCNQEVLPFVNTASVARDMLAIVDKSHEALTTTPRDEATNGLPRLNYIGYSYGTVLGNFFASMFPERVGKMILDGVADAYDFTSGPGALTNTVDADDQYRLFFEGCFQNPDTCALYHDGDTSAYDIEERVNTFISNLDDSSLVVDFVPARDEVGPTIVLTGNDVRDLFAADLYFPVQRYKSLAQVLELAITGGNYTAIGMRAAKQWFPNAELADKEEQGFAVRCIDGDDVQDKTADYWVYYTRRQLEQSQVLGQRISRTRFVCAGWSAKSNWNFDGPFTSPTAATGPTSPEAPILWLSNRYDPATPLRSARDMAQGHPGSRVIVSEAHGHCAMMAAPNTCLYEIVRRYMNNGSVPEDVETVCPADCGPWDAECSFG